MPSPETQRVIEIAAKETRWLHSLVELKDVENCLINILTQDRQHILEVLKEKINNIKPSSTSIEWERGYKQAQGDFRVLLQETLGEGKEINSIFKE